MLKKLKDYFKNTEKYIIYRDLYAIMFIIAGIASFVYLISTALNKG